MGDMKNCLLTVSAASLPSLSLLASTATPDWSSVSGEVFFWEKLN